MGSARGPLCLKLCTPFPSLASHLNAAFEAAAPDPTQRPAPHVHARTAPGLSPRGLLSAPNPHLLAHRRLSPASPAGLGIPGARGEPVLLSYCCVPNAGLNMDLLGEKPGWWRVGDVRRFQDKAQRTNPGASQPLSSALAGVKERDAPRCPPLRTKASCF